MKAFLRKLNTFMPAHKILCYFGQLCCKENDIERFSLYALKIMMEFDEEASEECKMIAFKCYA